MTYYEYVRTLMVTMNVAKTRRDEYAELTRGALLDAAQELFVGAGYDDTSIDDIARLARVSKGAVYHHFSDKRNLFAEVFRRNSEETLERVRNAMSEIPPTSTGAIRNIARLGLKAMLRCYIVDSSQRALKRLAPSVLGEEEYRRIDEDIALPEIRAMLSLLQAEGELQPVAIPMAASLILALICEAATTIALSDDPNAAMSDAEQVIDYMVSGLIKEA